MVKNFYYIKQMTISALLIFFAILIAFTRGLSDCVIDGISLWALIVLPSLLPYFFITGVLSKMSALERTFLKFDKLSKRVFNTSGITLYAYFISIISGYPIGAGIVSDLYENNIIDYTQAVRCSTFCSNASPMFMINSVGIVMFNDKTFGILLFVSNFISTLLTGFIFSFYKRSQTPETVKRNNKPDTDNVLYDCTYKAVISVLVVGGIITLFYLLVNILLSLKVFTPIIAFIDLFIKNKTVSEGLVCGIIECTNGLKIISATQYRLSLPISCSIVSFGGLSAILQCTAFYKKAKIKTAMFIVSKLLHAVFGFILGLILSLIFL